MNIILIIDNLGSGGAQRQLTLLAVLLKKRGYNVSLITYNQGDFFEPIIERENINRIKIAAKKWRRPWEITKIFSRLKPDTVIAFQNAASFYSELASLRPRSWRLIVSERTSTPSSELSFVDKIIRLFHVIANIITTNSHTNRLIVESCYPIFKKKIVTIYNATDLDYFKPIDNSLNQNKIRFLVLSSHSFIKNFEGLAKAIVILKKINELPKFNIDWFGDEAPGWFAKDEETRRKYQVEDVVFFHSATDKVVEELNNSDGLILPSLWEGLPNTVCEALSAGCPVLISDVCDARNLVIEEETGLLFDPLSPESIAESIRRFISYSPDKRQLMRKKARLFAEKMFDPENFVSRYEQLIQGNYSSDPELRHWPPPNYLKREANEDY